MSVNELVSNNRNGTATVENREDREQSSVVSQK